MATEIIEVFNAPTDVVEVLVAGPIGPQANINYTVVSSSQAVSNRQLIAANTLAGSFTLTLPSNPAAGDAIDIFDYSDTFDTNPLTIGRNGKNIEGEAEDLVANVEGAYFTLIFTGDSRGWQVVPRYGVAGVSTVSGTAPIVSSGGTTPTLSITAATTSAAGSMSSADKTKLDGIATGAEVNVQSNWTESNNALDSFILNKPATFTPSSHTHGNITNDGKVGAVSGLPVVTTTDGAVTTLALGTANQVLRVNSGATGVEFGAGFDAASPPAIGSTTPNSGAFTTLDVLTKGSSLNLRTNNDALAGLNTFTNINNAIGLNIGGTSHATLYISGTPFFALTRDTVLTWRTATNGPFSGTQTSLYAEDQNVLAQRVTTSPQVFRIYNTYTDASNYERLFIKGQTGGAFQIGTEAGGTGSVRPLGINVGSIEAIAIAINGEVTVRSRIYISTGSKDVAYTGLGSHAFSSVGTFSIRPWSGSACRINIGGDTSSFPALKRDTTTLQVRLADDSAFAPLAAGLTTLDGGTVTASAPVLDLAQTWNNAAVEFTSLRLNVTDTASAASGTRLLDLQVGGVSQVRVERNINTWELLGGGANDNGIGFGSSFIYFRNFLGANCNIGSNTAMTLRSDYSFGFSSTTNPSLAPDVVLGRDAADILAQRRTTNPQTFRLYNTYTDASNHERLSLRWASNVAIIGTEKGSVGGSARNLELQVDGVTQLTIDTGGTATFRTSVKLCENTPNGSVTMISGRIAITSPQTGTMILGTGTNALETRYIARRFSSGAGANFEQAFFGWSGTDILLTAQAGGSGELRGIKLGSASTSLLGFYGATPVVQQAAVADATDAATAITQLNDLLARLRTLGLIAT
jgi:hypothetical protein